MAEVQDEGITERKEDKNRKRKGRKSQLVYDGLKGHSTPLTYFSPSRSNINSCACAINTFLLTGLYCGIELSIQPRFNPGDEISTLSYRKIGRLHNVKGGG